MQMQFNFGALKGYLLGALAAATYGTNPAFAKPLYQDGMNPDSVLLFRYLFGLAMIVLLMLYNMLRKSGWRLTGEALSETFRVNRHSVPQLVIMGVLVALSSLTLFVSYNYMPVGIASTLLFVYPIMTAVIMMLCYGERLSWLVVLCLLLASGGVALLCRTGETDGIVASDFSLGVLIVMLSGLSYAIYLVGLNKTRLRTIASLPVTFYILLVGTLMFALSVWIQGDFLLPYSPRMWMNLLGLGLLPTVVSLIATARAIALIGSTQTAILGALEPVTAVFLGIVLLGETINLRESCGMALILGAVTLVVLRRR